MLMPGVTDFETTEWRNYWFSEAAGFVFGTNIFEDIAFGQHFIVDNPYQIVGATYWFGTKVGTAGHVTFKVWDMSDGVPGDVLYEEDVDFEDIHGSWTDDGYSFEAAYHITFATPVDVTDDYLIGVDVSNLDPYVYETLTEEVLYGLSTITSELGSGEGNYLQWILESNNEWLNTEFLLADGAANFDLGIFPFVIADDEDPDVVHELPFIEHFEGLEEDTPSTWLPEGWLNIDADGDGFSWFWTDWEDEEEEVYETYMMSYSWFDGTAFTPDNWLITPAIEFSEVEEDEIIELMFHIATIAQQPEFRAERYEVLISTTDNDPGSFTMIWEEVLPEDKDYFEWLERTADLSAYAGETVYLAFRHYGTSDLFGIALERVEVKVVDVEDEVDLFVYSDFEENQNVTFDGWPNVPEIVANPDVSEGNPSDYVGEWERSAEQWAHVWADLDGPINFETAQEFRLKVWSPIECVVLFKLENQADGSIFVEVPATVPVAEEWVELVFDFGDAESGLYDKIVIFFDFTATEDNTFYFDDVLRRTPEVEPEEFVYSISMLIPADDYQYKYFVVEDDPTWDLGEWVGDPNRSVTVDADMTVEDVWGEQPEKEGNVGDKGDAFYNVTFEVTIAEGTLVGDLAFDPAEHHIFIAGSLPDAFGWFWNEPGSNPLLELTIGDDDPINLSTPDISAPEAAVNIFPNPARNFVSIQSGENILTVTINDITGRTVKHMAVDAPEVTLNTSELISGFYLVNIYTESGVTVGKLQIQR